MKVERTAENRLELTIDGPITPDDVSKMVEDFLSKTEGMEHGEVLYTIRNFEMPSLTDLMVEMKHLPSLFGVLSRVDRVAVLADASWVRKAASLKGNLLPGITIKDFDLDQRAEAGAWLSEPV